MGVDVTSYLVYGIKLDYNEFREEFAKNFPDEDLYDYLQAEIEGGDKAEFDIIDDSMMGEYVVVGKIISQLSKIEEEFTTLSVKDLPNPSKLVEVISEKLKSNYTGSNFNLLFFNHFW